MNSFNFLNSHLLSLLWVKSIFHPKAEASSVSLELRWVSNPLPGSAGARCFPDGGFKAASIWFCVFWGFFWFFLQGEIIFLVQVGIWECQHISEKSEGYLRQSSMEREYLHLYSTIIADLGFALNKK